MIKLIEKSLAKIKGSNKEKYQLELSFEEALVNIIKYAYPDKPGDIEIFYEFPNQNSLKITIKDWGVAFDPTTFIPKNHCNLSLEDKPVGGLGIYFIFKLIDEVVYERKEGANILMLTKLFNNH
jgi:serine/threonine-protein kinase RsbW